MKIIIDSREQMPFLFEGYDCTKENGTLHTGDYSIYGLEDFVALERKSIGDLLGCFTTGRERFMYEMERLQSYASCAIVVESPFTDIRNGNYRSKLKPLSAIQSIFSIMQRYRMPFYFASNRSDAEYFSYNFLRHAFRHETDRLKKLSNQ